MTRYRWIADEHMPQALMREAEELMAIAANALRLPSNHDSRKPRWFEPADPGELGDFEAEPAGAATWPTGKVGLNWAVLFDHQAGPELRLAHLCWHEAWHAAHLAFDTSGHGASAMEEVDAGIFARDLCFQKNHCSWGRPGHAVGMNRLAEARKRYEANGVRLREEYFAHVAKEKKVAARRLETSRAIAATMSRETGMPVRAASDFVRDADAVMAEFNRGRATNWGRGAA